MNYPSIRIEGAILSPDIVGQIEELPGQRPSDFGLNAGTRVKDEIARAWADAQDYWRIFQRKLEAVKEGNNATSETRNLWMVPLLGLLRYDIEYQPRGTELDGRIYAISHRATNRTDTSVQIIGARDPAGLDRKPANATRRMSPTHWCRSSSTSTISFTVWSPTATCCAYSATAHDWSNKVTSSSTSTASSPMAFSPTLPSSIVCSTSPACR